MAARFTSAGRILVFFLLLCTTIEVSAQVFYTSTHSIDTTLLELPRMSCSDIVIFHSGYVTSFNPESLTPNWVAYDLTSQELEGTEQRSRSFIQDSCYTGRQAVSDDYKNSGYDRGHMAPAADMKWSKIAMRESFYLSNICPQTPSLNRRYWLSLEDLTRRMAVKYGNVWIICGPINGDSETRIGNNGVLVPTAFFKALLAYNGEIFIGAAFVMANDSEPHSLSESIMSIDNLEDLIQMDLFYHLDDEDEIMAEGITCKVDWDFL